MGIIINPFSLASSAASIVPEILWWKLNEGSGTAIAGAASAGGDAGTTDAAWGTGKSGAGSALDFNGTTHDSASNASIVFGASVLTVCFWVWLDTTSGARCLVESSINFNSNARAFLIYIDTGELFAAIHGATLYRAHKITAPSTGAWHHIAVVLDNSTVTGNVKIYLNGSLQSSTVTTNSKTGSGNFASYKVYAGARASASLFLDGRMDDLRIYNREVSAGDITSIYGDAQ